jgi:hypothetical protein
MPTGDDPRRPRHRPPAGWEPGVRYEGTQPSEVTIQVTEIPGDELEWRKEIARVIKLPIPDHRRVELSQVRYWGDPAAPFIYCRFVITDRVTEGGRLDLEDLIAAAKAAPPHRPAPVAGGRALVVAWADLQVGKTGSRGGTEELVQRVMERLDALDRYAEEHLCGSAYLVDVGDCVEGFQNTGAQLHTNDLSFPEQLRVARRLYTEAALRLAASHERVVCAGVPSNHGQWRRGKELLGKPGDDFGIEILTGVADAFSLNPDAFGHVSFRVPQPWEESIALDIEGTIVAAAHGHQANRPERIPQWWAGQVHGGQPAADADILLTGHFHNVRVQPSGRSAHTGRAKWWLQAPTLDNGSDWYRHRTGEDSDPALMVFTVDKDGWDNLKLL